MTSTQQKDGAPPNLVASAIEKIEQMISSGKLVPGQRLIEPDLVAELGVGRMPVREALRILAGDGVVELVPHKGASIRKMAPGRLAEMTKVQVGLLCVGMEEMIERPALALHLEELTAIHQEMRRRVANKDTRRVVASMIQYTEKVIAASENTYLMEVVRRTHFRHYERHIVDAVEVSELARLEPTYGEIIPLLRQRKAQQACRMLKACLKPFTEALVRNDSTPQSSRPKLRSKIRRSTGQRAVVRAQGDAEG